MSNSRAAGGTGRVLHLTDCYDGGVARAINDMVVNASGVHHVLAYHGTEEPPRGMFAEAFRVGGSTWSRMRQFRRIMREVEASLVHAHSSWAGGFARLGRSATPIVYQPHCYKFVDPTLPRPVAVFFRLLEKALLSNTAVTVVLSPAEQRAARSLGARRLAPVANVPSLPAGEASIESMSRPRVVMMGRLAPQKDPEFFLQVVRECRRSRPDVEGVWIGDGQDDMRTMLAAEGIRVTGWLDQEGVADMLSQGGVYTHTARYEGLPIAMLDAAQRRLAVVLRRIDAFTGIEELAQFDSVADMAAEALRLIRDREAYSESVAGGDRLLRQHTNERQARDLRALYAPAQAS